MLPHAHRNPARFLLPSILLVLCATSALAQGGNDCSAPTLISGNGTFAVNTAGATDSPQPTVCPTPHCDVWFRWTSPASQITELSLCGGVGLDTVAAVYSGSSCPVPGTEIACNDDSCGVQSTLAFSSLPGATYMIRIGCYYAATTFSGTFTLGLGAPCGGNTGPDIIVGDLLDVANYAGQNVGGTDYDAVAFGTYACNIGTIWSNWFGGSNLHPVIDNNLYRYKLVDGSGRFEQVGMSWLKHGFFALSDTLCCTGCQGTDGTHLGVHCADPYGAGLNGSQPGAGPRWQVNAATGVFTYPPANPSFSGSVARRCQVKTSDLELTSPSVRYFAEAQYVTQDDAAAGNDDNNASHRELSTSGAGTAWNFAFVGSTVREEPAILAWPTVDAGVQIANIDIPGDGRLILGWQVTPLGGGQWHYEYALFNLNSDRSVQALSVPKGLGVNLANIGFHDVAYHDGDGIGSVNFDGADWAAVNGGSSVRWHTSTFAQNPSANALRWGTMYNFRFDADVAPSLGLITLSTFKLPGNVTVQAQVPGLPQPGPFCFGDGTSSPGCPCANNGAPGNGCANSANASGALLSASGTSVPDTLVLTSSGELAAVLSILLQGDEDLANPVLFGDGLRCVGGNLKRLYVRNASGGSAVFPPPAALSISAQSSALGDPILPGTLRSYQVYYRDSDLSFCPAPSGNAFNASNAQRVVW